VNNILSAKNATMEAMNAAMLMQKRNAKMLF
jgi:hypothetical protein